jgi:hypothetical protein
MDMVCLGFLFAFKCSPIHKPAPVDVTFCEVARPLRWSSKDTRESKTQMDEQNKIGKALGCEWAK